MLLLIMKSINPKQNYLHITESCDCMLWLFAIISFLQMSFLISFGKFSKNYQKKVTLSFLTQQPNKV